MLDGCKSDRAIKSSKGYNVIGSNGRGYQVVTFSSSGADQRIIIVDDMVTTKPIKWEEGSDGSLVINGNSVVWRNGLLLYFESDGRITQRQFPVKSAIYDELNKDLITYEDIDRVVSEVSK